MACDARRKTSRHTYAEVRQRDRTCSAEETRTLKAGAARARYWRFPSGSEVVFETDHLAGRLAVEMERARISVDGAAEVLQDANGDLGASFPSHLRHSLADAYYIACRSVLACARYAYLRPVRGVGGWLGRGDDAGRKWCMKRRMGRIGDQSGNEVQCVGAPGDYGAGCDRALAYWDSGIRRGRLGFREGLSDLGPVMEKASDFDLGFR